MYVCMYTERLVIIIDGAGMAPSTSRMSMLTAGGGTLMDERSFVSSTLDPHHMITSQQPGYHVRLAKRNKLSAHRHKVLGVMLGVHKGDDQGNAPCPSKSSHDGIRWHHQHFDQKLSQSADLWPVF